MEMTSKEKDGRRFNICAFVNEYGKCHCWEGILGESWLGDKACTLLLK
jgi:hypothetical protein